MSVKDDGVFGHENNNYAGLQTFDMWFFTVSLSEGTAKSDSKGSNIVKNRDRCFCYINICKKKEKKLETSRCVK